jgi:uncharacterized protein (DUF849 family)
LTSPNRLLQAALNGDRDKTAHRATPVSVEELERDASACVAAGARAIHVHPRDSEGCWRLGRWTPRSRGCAMPAVCPWV